MKRNEEEEKEIAEKKRKKKKKVKEKKKEEGIEKIDMATESRWKDANAPRETVSWYEAVAFCRWLSHRTRSTIRLPTEWEWQQVATGGDPASEYPSPGGWDPARSNSGQSRMGQTTADGG